MNSASVLPASCDIVLVGGGHTHALVLRSWGMNPLPGARLTVIDPKPTAPYSGMLPGHVAGHYPREALDIDLVRLCRFAGARLIIGAAKGMDLAAGTVDVEGRAPVAFDVASIDVGITSRMPALPGFENYGVPAKPLGRFAAEWQSFLAQDGPARVAVLGAGVAGAELAMAMAYALRQRGRDAKVHLIDRGQALTAVQPASRRILLNHLSQQGVTLIENRHVTGLSDRGVETSEGYVEAGFITGAAGATPHPWLEACGLETEQGFIAVKETLQTSDARVFAVGDCAHMTHAPRPKAGVYAVRQAPVLLENLRAAAAGQPLQVYRPQKDYLKLISLGQKSALSDRFRVPLAGSFMWRWKDQIDQKFMQKFRELPPMPPPDIPREYAKGAVDALGDKPLCGGCGAKVGRGALAQITDGFEDAAKVDGLLVSHDHLRAFWDDPVVMTRIAAQHALGDVWAKGATPKAALIALTLPRMSDTLQARMLAEIMTTARATLREAGAEIVGGHTSLGSELTVGFTVMGQGEGVELSGAQPSDQLILTKPLGTGVIMAAEMDKKAPGAIVAQALASMLRGQSAESDILGGVATAMTDVTGFGLAGHLEGMCTASGVGATLRLDDVPMIDGALNLSDAGHRSSIFPQNRALVPHWPDTGKAALLFDPQTSGGLLAAVPAAKANDTLDALRRHSDQVAVIGEITASREV
ncbi:MAG: selenide, water dikinase SelD, partial [Rhodobacteraceae bacterium]|nr:selenide, water dikinase SelD [Paracoccaceae bacterium]